MNKTSNYLKISGILYLIPATLLILEVPLMGALLFILGIYLVANSFLSQEELNKNKLFLIIATIISISFNQIAAVLIIMTIDEISSAKKDNINAPPEISSSSRKTDILIKIALGMILISGILFAGDMEFYREIQASGCGKSSGCSQFQYGMEWKT